MHGLGRIAHGRNPVSSGEVGDDSRDAGQNVHVLVTVEMTDGEAGLTHATHLRVELRAHLLERDAPAQHGAEQVLQVRRECAARPDQRDHFAASDRKIDPAERKLRAAEELNDFFESILVHGGMNGRAI